MLGYISRAKEMEIKLMEYKEECAFVERKYGKCMR